MRVQGFCPMGCGQTLVLGEGGHVTCSLTSCPNPGAVDTILGQPETEHIVSLSEEHFTVTHPLRERLGDLASCELHQWIADRDGPPAAPGRYRVRRDGPSWRFERLEAEAA